jgi:hypothetical protein
MLTLQLAWVVETLPHDSAETSNTDSNLTDGVLYGFFAPACSGAFSFELLTLFNCLSQDSISRLPHSQNVPLVVFRPQWRRQRTILIQI